MTGPRGLAGSACLRIWRLKDLSPAGSYLKLYKIGTSNYVPWRSALGRRARAGHTGVSIMQMVVACCHNVWDMILQGGGGHKENGIISHYHIQTL